MPDKEFIEQHPLYRKFPTKVPTVVGVLPKVRINMSCPTCSSNQTFAIIRGYWEMEPGNSNAQFRQDWKSNVERSLLPGLILRMSYRCTHCEVFERVFFVKFDPKGKWMMKVGQFPPWETGGNSNIEKLLGEHSDYYRKGLKCESQAYGIGAFGYYRRIVEEIIDALLEEVSHLLSGEELNQYESVLELTKKTLITSEKIDLVKDLLPPILRPDGMNPLSVLHSSLSEGLHASSDEDCLECAGTCRQILIFLVSQVAASRATSKNFTENMRKVLERKAKATS